MHLPLPGCLAAWFKVNLSMVQAFTLKRAVGGGAAKKLSGDSPCLRLHLTFKLKVSLGLSYLLYQDMWDCILVGEAIASAQR